MNIPANLGKYKRTKQSMMRGAATRATYRHTLGGRLKKPPRPEPSLPKLKCLDDQSSELPSEDR